MSTEEAIIEYLKNTLVTPEILHSKTKDDRGTPIPQRFIFVKLRGYAENFFRRGNDPRMLAISGLRGVGKTTLMWQTAEVVFNERCKEIYFISVDDLNRLGVSLYEAFSYMEKHVFGCSLAEIDRPVMFLIDEVHEAEQWDKDLKILYERCQRAFIVCTGSSALLLHKSPDLASRWNVLKLYPFRFAEFVLAKSWVKDDSARIYPERGLGSAIRNAIYFSSDHQGLVRTLEQVSVVIQQYLKKVDEAFGKSRVDLLNEYIGYHNIARFLRNENRGLIMDRVIALFDRILAKDLPEFDAKEDAAILNRLILRLAISDEVTYHQLSKEMKCKQTEIEHFMDSLDKAEVLNVFLPSGGPKNRTGASRKAFFMSPSLRRALYSRIYGPVMENDLRAKLYEDIVAMYLRKSLDPGVVSYGASSSGPSPDFIISTRDMPIVIEVGTNKASTKQLRSISKKRYGILINAEAEAMEVREDRVVIPLTWFLLS